jgi:hypothetical protein
MSPEMRFLFKTFPANVTGKGTFSRVNANMVHEPPACWEDFATHEACVDVRGRHQGGTGKGSQ